MYITDYVTDLHSAENEVGVFSLDCFYCYKLIFDMRGPYYVVVLNDRPYHDHVGLEFAFDWGSEAQGSYH